MEPERQLVSLLSFLEAENARLRQAIIDLSFDTMTLRETLARERRNERDANFGERDRSSTARSGRVTLVHDASHVSSK
jgi:hypothetical protein